MVIKLILHPRNNWLSASDYSLQEQADIYDRQLADVLENTRWYLDNLEKLVTYRVTWHAYNERDITLPFRHIRHQKHTKKGKLYK
jgi:hypothetical protein